MNYLELTSQVKAGEALALPAFIDLKRQQKEIEAAIKEIQDLAIDEANKYTEKSFKLNGAIIEKRSSPATWDYSGVQQYQDAKDRLAYIQKLAQIGGMDDSGNEVQKAVRIEGKENIAIKFTE